MLDLELVALEHSGGVEAAVHNDRDALLEQAARVTTREAETERNRSRDALGELRQKVAALQNRI